MSGTLYRIVYGFFDDVDEREEGEENFFAQLDYNGVNLNENDIDGDPATVDIIMVTDGRT